MNGRIGSKMDYELRRLYRRGGPLFGSHGRWDRAVLAALEGVDAAGVYA